MSYFPRIHGIVSALYDAGLPTYTDLDGNEYSYVDIGSQRWIVENFRCTKFADGTDIPSLTEATYNDYFLPSRDELQAMYDELFLYDVGDFDYETKYWSSSEANEIDVYLLDSGAGDMETGTKDADNYSARACRSFTSTTVYALRDTGPAGGLIFYVEDLGGFYLYLEAATEDQAATTAWSNITTALGTTGTGIGDGEANTAEIIAQDGHTASAAKLCADVDNGVGGGYTAYDNDEDNVAAYGYLYNWHTLANLCYLEFNGVEDTEWRVPSDSDYAALITYLGGNPGAGGKLKETGTTYWKTPNTGATNSSGFTGRPGGYHDDTFYSIRDTMFLWTTTPDGTSAWSRGAVYTTANTFSVSVAKTNYLSVRLVKDI